jgi:surface protein
VSNKFKVLRSDTKGVRPATGQAGELYVNFADKQIGVFDTTGNPVDLIPLRTFSTLTDYALNDMVQSGDGLWRANAVIPAGAWDATLWTRIDGAGNAIVSTPPAGTSQVITAADPADTPLRLEGAVGQTAWLANIAGMFVVREDGRLQGRNLPADLTANKHGVFVDDAGLFFTDPPLPVLGPVVFVPTMRADALGLTMNNAADGAFITLPITFPTGGTARVDWGDGTTEDITSDDPSHTYATAGNKAIIISGGGEFSFVRTGDKDKLISIQQFGVFHLATGAFNSCSNLVSTAGHWTCPADMASMFYSCTSLTVVDATAWDTSAVTDMHKAFSRCSSLVTLDFSSWNTPVLKTMANMFDGCSSITTLDLSHLDVSAVTSMTAMFQSCGKLTTVDLSSWVTSSVKNMSAMFFSCGALTTIDVTHFDTAAVTDMHNMFLSCKILTVLDVTHFDTAAVKNMSGMFSGCAKLVALDITSFRTPQVTDMDLMFNKCTKLLSLDFTNFDTSSVKNMSHMFDHCAALTALDLHFFNTAAVTNMSFMFQVCTKLISINVTGWNTALVANMTKMFFTCPDLTTLDVTGFDVSGVTAPGMTDLFLTTTAWPDSDYQAALTAWAALTVNPGIHLDASPHKNGGVVGYATLTGGANLWVVTDGGP